MSFCSCKNGLSNTGTPACESIQSVTKKLIYLPLRNSAGVRNGIDITDVIDQTYLDARINDSDESQRWYPTPYIENVEDTKGDSVFESLNSGSNIFIQEGPRTFTGVHIKASSQFLGKLKSGRCVDFGVYLIDIDGNLTGSVSTDGTKLYPVAVDKETYNPVLVKATDTTVGKIQVSFEFSRVEKDENLRTISASSITADILGSNGLLDSFIASSSITATSAVLTISTSYGSFGSPIMVEGLTSSDVVLFNQTTSSPIAVGSLTETAEGVYSVTFAAQTASDVIRVSLNKSGFIATPITFVAA